ncbi:MAG: aminotransferase class V-fold PLP-dependent enzyme [Syntrophobacteraceae bacterium]|nr:aminotransferase class V-fold PLP-dependent enzyme [Syntrophobacteraceae bacterium]
MALYLDNAATTYPKPMTVYDEVRRALEEVGASPGRAAHRRAREASAIVAGAREKVAKFLGILDPNQVIFTKNATESINIVLKGYLRPGDRVLISGVEHNAVVRPLSRLAGTGVKTETIPCDIHGEIDLEKLRLELLEPARLMVLNHASNVNGALQPVSEILALCGDKGVPVLLDAAQTAGLQEISVHDLGLGMFACSGHKALLGPPGTGILYVRPDLPVQPLVEGGTGSRSEEEVQPEICPDRYESGTLNLPGIAGLAAGIEFLEERGSANLLKHETGLAHALEEGLTDIPGVRVLKPIVRGTGTVSFTLDRLNPSHLSHLLDEVFDIAVRPGLHCAPLAHRTLGTFPHGTVRVSPGFSTSQEDIIFFLESLQSILSLRG